MLFSAQKTLENCRDARDLPKIRVVEKYTIVDHEEAGLFDTLADAKDWYNTHVKGN